MEITKGAQVTIATNKTKPEPLQIKNLICFSHLRWDFVYQRPQHLLSRFSTKYPVYFIEEPIVGPFEKPILSIDKKEDNLFIIKPHFPHATPHEEFIGLQKQLLDEFIADKTDLLLWYYTPMALVFSKQVKAAMVVYDCMDELSNFKFAPPQLKQLENELFNLSDIVFTGGHSLFKAKKHLHDNIFPFPSSIDKKHFEKARTTNVEPEDQKNIPHPRFGFYGVIDERFDIELIRDIAEQQPNWHLVILGPVVKIDPASLPGLPNIHYLGSKSYDQLPDYLATWDISFIPFLLNEATQFISPTKTPEYLAAGVPVISTPIADVVKPYGEDGFVKIAANAQEFIAAGQELLLINKDAWIPIVDEYLAKQSWDLTFSAMMEEVNNTLIKKQL